MIFVTFRRMLKRVTHIVLLLLVVNAATEVHQLFKIPALLEHYQHHLRNNPSLSLLDFLRIHYSPDHPNDADSQEDSQLPFRAVGTLSHIDINWVPAYPEETPALTAPALNFPVVHGAKTIRRSYAIFHPPRQV